ncbi:hypothetical protein BDV59DRAFT_188092 [Aspergillus ambiguus]|uniref:uncharacterized protein n=1 Tax=Aspergillus ambiguus TaxID=176160 RepID=UPI003CCD2E7A
METSRDYSSIVHSPPFTFLVGPSHTKLTVQSGLARHVSKPLDHLMNSGQTRESKHHIAVLEDEDVETFVAFCEYAYTGDYSVPPPGLRQDDKESVPSVNSPSLRRTFTAEGRLSPTNPSYLPSPPTSAGPLERDRGSSPAVGEVQYSDDVFKTSGVGDGVKVEGTRDDSAASVQRPAWEDTHSSDNRSDRQTAEACIGEVDPRCLPVGIDSFKEKTGKSGKSKKKGTSDGRVDDPTVDLTPLSTTPTGKLEDGGGLAPVETTMEPNGSEKMLQSNEASQTGNATEADGTDGSHAKVDGWEESAGTTTPPTDETATPDADKTDEYESDSREDVEHYRADSRGPIIDTSFAKQHFSFPHETGISMWDEFVSLDYIDPRQFSSTRPPSVLSMQSTPSSLPYLVFHAKVYVFAARYLIPALAQLCLRKLHRDLVNLDFPDGDFRSERNADDDEIATLTSTKAKMVLDLLHYTYTKTTRLEPISPTSATQLRDNELRKLVTHYAACKVRDLAEHCPPMEGDFSSLRYPVKASSRGMRALLDTTPELASDLVYRMM